MKTIISEVVKYGLSLIVCLSIFIGTVTILPSPVLAQDSCSGDMAQTEYCKNQPKDAGKYPLQLVMRITQIAIYLAGALAVIFIVIGGVRYALSQGNSEQTSAAKNTILYAVIGLVIAIFAQVLVSFIISRIK